MKIIFNADDFGITRSCNAAIIDCYRFGVLSSASLMVNMPAAEHAAELWERYPGLSVGIHFNITVGKALSKAGSLQDENGRFSKRILENSEDVIYEDIIEELSAQYDRFITLTGHKPHHITSHHYIERICGGREAQIYFSNLYNIPVRQFLGEGANVIEGLKLKTPITADILKIGAEPARAEDLKEFFSPDELSGDEIYEVAGHPGYVDADLLGISSLTTGRCHDAAFMLSEDVKRYIEENKITIVDYRELCD